ncbi:MAG: DUF1919 domain-containing protein [Methanobrevibacter sp.]|nr:DUF1919 domain-containing protein [Methanobrevibacter sp.]
MALIVLIGDIESYQSKFNLIDREMIKGNISVAAAFFNEEVEYAVLDNFNIVNSLDELKEVYFDYFILLDDDKSWFDILSNVYRFEQKIIPIRVFEIPLFDFGKYEQILQNPPSIISRHCWGGILYNYLGLKFNSPFVNLFILDEDFNKISKNFLYYIDQELVFDREEYEHNLKRNYPVAKLDDIYIYFNHYTDFEEAKRKWDERKKRINYSYLIFETTTENRKTALEFDAISLDYKLCFYSGKLNASNIIDFSEFMKNKQVGTLGMLVNHTANGQIPYFDLLELLVNFNYKPRIKFL